MYVTGILVLKKFLLSILKFLEADNTVSEREVMMMVLILDSKVCFLICAELAD